MTADEEAVATAVRAAAGDVTVVVIGSRGAGTARSDSDWDVVVVVPGRRIPFLLPKLRRVSASLSQSLGVRVTVNPVTPAFIRRMRPTLYAHKVSHGAVLAGAAPPISSAPPVTAELRFSCAVSAALYVLGEGAHGEEKARALIDELRALRGDAPSTEPTAAEAVLAEAPPVPQGVVRAARRNITYLVLSFARGRSRVRAAASLTPIDARLGAAALLLLSGAESDVAARLLPPTLRRRATGPDQLRAILVDEWPSAHPLAAL